MNLRMSLLDNKTAELWRSFMPRRNEVQNRVGSHFLSMQVYDDMPDFANLDLVKPFTKWAIAEVSSFENIPDGMQTYTLEGGLYAMFIHRGLPQAFPQTARYIFGEWLPNSLYRLDHREHFELLGEKYKNNSPDSEEEIWIPIVER